MYWDAVHIKVKVFSDILVPPPFLHFPLQREMKAIFSIGFGGAQLTFLTLLLFLKVDHEAQDCKVLSLAFGFGESLT